jgi:hypothetical protein
VLGAHTGCAFTFTFTPSAPARLEHTTLIISDNGVAGAQQSISLSGTGS